MNPTVTIAGAGIGGLTLAIALRRRGVSVTVLERTPEIRLVGAGLGLGPNAIGALRPLGLASAIVEAGAPLTRSALLDTRGRALGSELDLGRIARAVGAPAVALHRTRLHEILLRTIDPGIVRLGFPVGTFERRGGRVLVTGPSGERVESDLLVGADGLNSAVRARLVVDGPPRYAGYSSWRGVTPSGSVPRPSRMTETWGRGQRFGIVDIGFGEIYWFAVADAPPGGADGSVHDELLARFGRWHEPIADVIRATPADRIVRTDISDRDPITRWHDDGVVLLGDAAHPMTPNLGQGAGQAIEDAVALDRCLSAGASIESTLIDYEARRVSRANSLVLASRRVGAIAQWSHPAAVWFRNLGMRLTPASVAQAQARKLVTVHATGPPSRRRRFGASAVASAEADASRRRGERGRV